MPDESFGIKIENSTELLYSESLKQNKNSVELHNWQREGIKYFFDNGCKAIFNASTGTGKTIFAIELLKRILEISPDSRILIVVPKNIIMESGWYNELYNGGFNLQDIGVFYGNIKECCKITITNMQSIEKVPLELYDVLVCDEAHNFCTSKNMKWVNFGYKYMIGLSATIERTDGKHWDIIKAFDYNVFKYTPKQALQEGILNSFYYFDIGVEMDDDQKDSYDTLSNEIHTMYQI
jgi:superfamily II DNA or RNA helicase